MEGVFSRTSFNGIIKRSILILVAMNKQYAIALLVVTGIAFTSGLIFGRQNSHPMADGQPYPLQKKNVDQRISNHTDMTMNEMVDGLQGKTGDSFDKAFVEMMIVHHEGAVEMAKLIEVQGKHNELKKLGQDIVTTQSREIDMMKGWLRDWGYASQSDDTHNMDH